MVRSAIVKAPCTEMCISADELKRAKQMIFQNQQTTLTMNIPNHKQLCALVNNIDEILNAPANLEVTVWEDNPYSDGKVTSVGQLREALEHSVYDYSFGGWLFVFPGDVAVNDGCYKGWFSGSYFWVSITSVEYQI